MSAETAFPVRNVRYDAAWAAAACARARRSADPEKRLALPQERCSELEAELQAAKVELAQATAAARAPKRLAASGRKKPASTGKAKGQPPGGGHHLHPHFRPGAPQPGTPHQPHPQYYPHTHSMPHGQYWTPQPQARAAPHPPEEPSLDVSDTALQSLS